MWSVRASFAASSCCRRTRTSSSAIEFIRFLCFHLERLQGPLDEQILSGIGCHRFRIYLDEGAFPDPHHFDRRPGILCPHIIDRRLNQVAIKHLDAAAEEAGNCPATHVEGSIIRALFWTLQSHDEQTNSPE